MKIKLQEYLLKWKNIIITLEKETTNSI